MGKKGKQLRTKMFLICIGTFMVMIALQIFFNIRISFGVLQEQISEATSKSIYNIKSNFETEVKQMKDEFALIYQEEDFIDALSDGQTYAKLRQQYASIARQFATDAFPTQQRVVSMYFYDLQHQCISYYRHADTPIYRYPTDIYGHAEYSNAQIVKDYIASERSDMLISSYYNENRQSNILRFVYKIYVDNRGRMVGYIVCDVDEKPFINAINAYTYYDKQVVYMQPLGDRIAIEVGEAESHQEAILEEASSRIRQEPFSVNSNIASKMKHSYGNRFYLQSLSRYGVEFYSMLPESMLYESRRNMLSSLLISSMVILATGILLFWMFTNYLTIPLKRLVTTMRAVSAGDRKQRIENITEDEIGELGENFNTMLDEIEHLITEEYETKILQKNAEYHALQAQINPHFLYNTLDTMSGIARMKNCIEVSELCQALSGMFRYSMDMQSDLVSLQKEVAHIRNYLYVMTTRMQNEIMLSIQIDASYMSCLLPKMTLQPIVENAIKHGLQPKRGEKRLDIYACKIEQQIHIIIEDNGVGMDADAINHRLQQQNKEEKIAEEEEEKDSIGIFNINRRIKMKLGETCGIMVESEPGKGSKVHIIICEHIENADHI